MTGHSSRCNVMRDAVLEINSSSCMGGREPLEVHPVNGTGVDVHVCHLRPGGSIPYEAMEMLVRAVHSEEVSEGRFDFIVKQRGATRVLVLEIR